MKETLITILRDSNSTIEQFRQATDQLGTVMAIESSVIFQKATIFVDTPLAKTHGVHFKHTPLLVPILRSGLVMLHRFIHFYPSAKVGFIGARRNEETAIADLYYSNLPAFDSDTPILLLDPMIATGGSASLSVEALKKAGADERQITLISFIGSPEGILRFQKEHPEAGLLVAQTDEGLNASKWIVPGLGDFGDRYFGTESC